MMKNIILAVLIYFIMPLFYAKADICVYNSAAKTNQAVELMENVKEAIHYCPTCVGDNQIRKLSVDSVKTAVDKEDGEMFIYLNGEQVDIAYLYLPTEKENIFQNLGYRVGCADFSNTEVKEFLNIEQPYGAEMVNKLRQKLEKCRDFEDDRDIQEDEDIIEQLAIQDRVYADKYEKCVYDVLGMAVAQFYPQDAVQINTAFAEMAANMKKYYSYFEPEYRQKEYIVKFKTNVLLEYAVATLLNDVAARFGE